MMIDCTCSLLKSPKEGASSFILFVITTKRPKFKIVGRDRFDDIHIDLQFELSTGLDSGSDRRAPLSASILHIALHGTIATAQQARLTIIIGRPIRKHKTVIWDHTSYANQPYPLNAEPQQILPICDGVSAFIG